MKRLHKKLFSEIDVGDLEDVPDAEAHSWHVVLAKDGAWLRQELEEECQELERILAEQEKDIEALSKLF